MKQRDETWSFSIKISQCFVCPKTKACHQKKTIGNIKDLKTNNVSRIDGCVIVPHDMGAKLNREMAEQVELKM